MGRGKKRWKESDRSVAVRVTKYCFFKAGSGSNSVPGTLQLISVMQQMGRQRNVVLIELAVSLQRSKWGFAATLLCKYFCSSAEAIKLCGYGFHRSFETY